MSTGKHRKKRLSIDSSSEEDAFDEKTPIKTVVANKEGNTRSSERIHRRRNRSFQMPSREDVWNSILPTKSPDKYYHLKPKKLINNFTKENNSYNYDPIYTSGSESMDDFIDDDDALQHTSSKKHKVQKKKVVHRIRNKHSRVIHESSDTDSSHLDGTSNNADKATQGTPQDKISSRVNESRSNMDEGFDEGIMLDNEPAMQGDKNNGDEIQGLRHETEGMVGARGNECESAVVDNSNRKENSDEIKDDDNNDDDELSMNLTHGRKRRKSNKIESDDEDNCRGSGSDSDSNIGAEVVKLKRRKSKALESESSSGDESKLKGEASSVQTIKSDQTDGGLVTNGSARHENNANTSKNDDPCNENSKNDAYNEDCNNECIGNNEYSDHENFPNEDSNEIVVIDSDNDDDSFVVDDEEEESNFDTNDDDGDEDDDTSNSSSDSETGSNEETNRRKNKVRVKMVQKKKERDSLFEQLREARKRKKSKENSGQDND